MQSHRQKQRHLTIATRRRKAERDEVIARLEDEADMLMATISRMVAGMDDAADEEWLH